MENLEKTPTQPLIHNLVFQGGSVRGMAYLGALQAMVDSGFDFTQVKRIAGTSAGAITALLVSLGYTVKELKVYLDAIDFKAILDGKSPAVQNKVLKSADKVGAGKPMLFATAPAATVSPKLICGLSSTYGVFDGNYFLDWVQTRLQERTGDANITFAELHALHVKNPQQFKDLYVYGANISLGLSQQFSWETTPQVTVASAVRISMSLPWVFKPFSVLEKNKYGSVVPAKKEHVYVDGGLLDNYPINAFDHSRYQTSDEEDKPLFNPHTLGFRLLDTTKIDFFKENKPLPVTETANLLQFSMAVLNTLNNKQNSDHNLSADRTRTIYINTVGVNTLDFDLTADQKQALILAGQAATYAFFRGEAPNYQPAQEALANNSEHLESIQEEENDVDSGLRTTSGCILS